ncbi:hypothetical protein Y032_0202g1769 [Ancylostoma ceylanicum]|uniref:Uncharacterized protein n=1 Tax=Ancylostoma ceylanicum TaxID=53326 RepID=A0A016SMY9_9BILA|nr:hypothetical protein Y032_0202g1769 [Ancylostoma ceylanicum]
MEGLVSTEKNRTIDNRDQNEVDGSKETTIGIRMNTKHCSCHSKDKEKTASTRLNFIGCSKRDEWRADALFDAIEGAWFIWSRHCFRDHETLHSPLVNTVFYVIRIKCPRGYNKTAER